MEPARGDIGFVKVGPALTAVIVNGCNKYDTDGSRDKNTKGPYWGDTTPGKTYVTLGPLEEDITIEGDVPKGGDPGLDDVHTLWKSGSADRFEVGCLEGYTITIASGKVTNFKLSNDSSDGPTFSFTVAGDQALAVTEED